VKDAIARKIQARTCPYVDLRRIVKRWPPITHHKKKRRALLKHGNVVVAPRCARKDMPSPQVMGAHGLKNYSPFAGPALVLAGRRLIAARPLPVAAVQAYKRHGNSRSLLEARMRVMSSSVDSRR